MKGFRRQPLDELLEGLRRDERFTANVTAWHTFPPREAERVGFPEGLDGRLVDALRQRGIESLFSHQAESFRRIREGRNVAVVTPTASGKTLCYNLPVLNRLLEEPHARALYLFPTKALSADQVDDLHGLVTAVGADIKTFTFDGDTPATARRAIRAAGHIVVTNPDMLHAGILPHHTRWVRLFENLRFVILDEVHQYRGVFGSHMANVLRRLKRLCRFYDARPQFIGCSATIANPRELAESLTGEPMELVDRCGAPAGKKHFIIYNPPVVNRELGIRRSMVKTARDVACRFMEKGQGTILFARSRLNVEVLLTYLRTWLKRRQKATDLVRGYRGGYLPRERRTIEADLREGAVLGVVSTNALELGIDIGALDVAVMAGYPGSIASAWQQAGRAGRRSGEAVAVLVSSSSPLDQYLANNPDYFFARSPETGTINADNLVILMSHIKCAAFELPFEEGEGFGVDAELLEEILLFLEEHRVLRHAGGRWHWMCDIYPAGDVSLRSASPENVVIHDLATDRVVGEVDTFSAPLMVHEDAIYLHDGKPYQVERFDPDQKRAEIRPAEVDYYTDAEAKTNLKVLEVLGQRAVQGGTIGHGEVVVTTLPVLYKKIRFQTHENVGWGHIHLPEQEMQTTAFWFAFEESVPLGKEELGVGLAALAHVLSHTVPLFVLGERSDIRTLAMVNAPFTQTATIFIYDNYPGGVGFSEAIFDAHEAVLKSASELIERCPCKEGCPCCVGPILEFGERAKPLAQTLLAHATAQAAAGASGIAEDPQHLTRDPPVPGACADAR